MPKKSNEFHPISLDESILNHIKLSFPEILKTPSKKLAKSILKASDQYIFSENKSLWSESWFIEAYLSYFIYTQAERLNSVLQKAYQKLPPHSISEIVDFGCGPGTAQLVSELKGYFPTAKWLNLDHEEPALKIAKKLLPSTAQFKNLNQIPKAKNKSSMLILSYSLCEGLNVDKIWSYDHIVILEPGQIENSKKLIELRQLAIEKDFFIAAPCCHLKSCPLSKEPKHWCHDTVKKPKLEISAHLPFSENKLNFSYLILSKTKPMASEVVLNRVIGDLRIEKGKSKIAVCRPESMKYLSWLKKSKLKLQIHRGDLIEEPQDYEEKSNEIRIKKNINIFKD